MAAITQAERTARLETKVEDIENTLEKMDGKLDDLLALRNRGVGAFWLAATLLGSGIIGLVANIFGWFKH